MLRSGILNAECYTSRQYRFTPCLPTPLALGAGTAARFHGGCDGSDANGAHSVPSDRLGNRYRHISGITAVAEHSYNARRRSVVHRCGRRAHRTRAARTVCPDHQALEANYHERNRGGSAPAADCRHVAVRRIEELLVAAAGDEHQEAGGLLAPCCVAGGMFAGLAGAGCGWVVVGAFWAADVWLCTMTQRLLRFSKTKVVCPREV